MGRGVDGKGEGTGGEKGGELVGTENKFLKRLLKLKNDFVVLAFGHFFIIQRKSLTLS